MLSPDDRSLLVDLLAAPDGFRLDEAVATTFTLELTALLAVPLAFAGADLSSGADPLTALQAIREYSERIDVFCQAGNIAVPPKPNDLLSFLEPIVHQVERPRAGRLFHPKLWALRFAAVDDPSEQCFRLICGSRNLTHDCAWDAVITLDGTPISRRRRAVNNPLVDFISSLPDRAPSLSKERASRIENLAESLRSVEWDPPPDVFHNDAWLAFHTFGRVRSTTPDLSGDRNLVISPFINDDGITQFEPAVDLTIISRSEELDQLNSETRKWLDECDTHVLVLDEDAAIPDVDAEAAGRRWSLSGLHAKAYVFERGQRAHVLIGSANSTDAAWSGNDEFLVEIIGRRRTYGIDTITEAKSSFGSLLSPYELGEPTKPDPNDELLRQLENALRDLVGTRLVGTLTGSDTEGWVETITSDQALQWGVPEAQLTVSLLTLPAEARAATPGEALDVTWKLHELEDATPFATLRLRIGAVEASTVALAHLVGDPVDRLDRVLARQFSDKTTFLRFLLMLLALAGDTGSLIDLPLFNGPGEAAPWATQGSGLLESLMKALATAPSAIDDVGRLVDHLSATEAGRAVLPPGWDNLWQAVLEARARVRAV
jgi:hypothetical protein